MPLLGRRESFWIVAATFWLFLFAASAPSPLYALYAARWHFSSIALTEVFAVYALSLLVALIFTGSLSDALGRRPVILAALALQLGSMILFLVATGLPWLFAARTLQGFATGVVTSAVAAALLDLQPSESPTLGSLVNSATPTLGLAFGGLVAAALVQYAPYPLQLVYCVMLASFAIAAVGVALTTDAGIRRPGVSLLPRIGVERSVRGAFIGGLPTLISVWALGGFYLSLGPSLVLQLAGTTNRLLGGLAIFLLAGCGGVTTLALRGWAPRRAMLVGGGLLIVGVTIGVLAVAGLSTVAFLIGTAVAGGGFGLAFLGTFRTLAGLAAPHGRGGLIAAIYIVAYVAFALPAVAAGYLATLVGLHDTALWYGSAVGILALLGALGAWRTTSAAHQVSAANVAVDRPQ